MPRKRTIDTTGFIKEQGTTWKAYERLTSYECAQRRKDYDAAKCAAAWEVHAAVYDKYGYPRPPIPHEVYAYLHSSTG